MFEVGDRISHDGKVEIVKKVRGEHYVLESGKILEKSMEEYWVPATGPATSTSVKQDQGKRRMDLLPWSALDEVGDVLTYGIAKYPEPKDNWYVNSTKEDISRYRAALVRHMSARAQGEIYDPESGLPHDAHIATNSLFIVALEKKYG